MFNMNMIEIEYPSHIKKSIFEKTLYKIISNHRKTIGKI